MPALSYTTALGGGIIRDLLIGVTPPATFTDSRYLIVPTVCGVLTFYVHPALSRVRRPLMVFDAAGLGLFAVAGAQKSIDAGLNMPSPVAVAGVLATFAIRVISKWRGWSAPIAQER